MLGYRLAIWLALALGAVALLGALYSSGYHRGYANAEARCEAEALRAQLAEERRQRRAAEEALAEANKLYDEQRRESDDLNKEADAYVAELEKVRQNDDACTLTDDDVERLRKLH